MLIWFFCCTRTRRKRVKRLKKKLYFAAKKYGTSSPLSNLFMERTRGDVLCTVLPSALHPRTHHQCVWAKLFIAVPQPDTQRSMPNPSVRLPRLENRERRKLTKCTFFLLPPSATLWLRESLSRTPRSPSMSFKIIFRKKYGGKIFYFIF